MKDRVVKQQQKEFLNELVPKLEQAADLEEIMTILQGMIDEDKKEIVPTSDGFYTFAAEKAMSVFAEDSKVVLKPLRNEVKEQFLQVLFENSMFPQMFEMDSYRNQTWSSHFGDNYFYCSIHDKESDAFIGYCGIKNSDRSEWEMAIELLQEHHRKGYGHQALELFMSQLASTSGQHNYIAKVDPDNVPSQRLMEKLHGEPAGVDTFMITDEDKLAEIERDCAGDIDDRLRALAAKFQVPPEKLLCRVLVYRFQR